MSLKAIKVDNIGYFPIPKNACTSIKSALFTLEHGRAHDQELDQGKSVHHFYRKNYTSIASCEFRFIVLRDPIKRFISAFNNRVGHHRELTHKKIGKTNPELLTEIKTFQPNINQYVDDFLTYYKVRPIKHHSGPISEMLPDGLAPFTNVYKIENLSRLEKDLSHILSRDVVLPRLQTEGTRAKLGDLSREQLEFLIEFYQQDYELLSDYYSIDDIRQEWEETKTDSEASAPFIIWTFRRTGGTNLSSTLFEQSEFDGIQHEPFNRDRKFGGITQHWLDTNDYEQLYRAMDKVLSKRKLIKHCLEIIPEELNTALAELSVKYGYKHLFLYREKATDRLLSLNYALKTNIWSKQQYADTSVSPRIFKEKIPVQKLLNEEISSRQRMQKIYSFLISHGASPAKISFENIYTEDPEKASKSLKGVFHQLLGSNKYCSTEVLERILSTGKQSTNNEYLRFPNSAQFIAEIEQLPPFQLEQKSLSKEPLISIVVPVYNVSEYINRCLNSVLKQTYPNLEILVIDDRGQDDSMDKIRRYSDERIKVITHDQNRGLAAARNTGINNASGEFILFLDSDDYVTGDLIEKCLLTQQADNVDCVVFNTQFVDNDGGTWVNEWMENFYGNTISNKCIDDTCSNLLVGWDVAAWSKLIRLEYLKQHNIYFQEEQRYFEDHYFSAKLFISKIRFSYIDERLHYYFKRPPESNQSITQMSNPQMSLYRSRMLKDVCLLIEAEDNHYKNIFYPSFLSFYKFVISEAFSFKEHQKEVFNNMHRAFANIDKLEVIKKMELRELDLALLMARYDYDEYMTKFGSIWNYTTDDLREVTPEFMQDQLSEYTPAPPQNMRFGLGLLVSAIVFSTLCLCKLKLFKRHKFLLTLRDFHVIFRLGNINHPNRCKGPKRWLKIFNYVVSGEKAGFKINSQFEASKYLEMNPELNSMNMGLYAHFLFYSESQNRKVEGLK